ncbi:YicC/YloC family endoribonuclease [Peptoniphilus obesi]|uniref:YicC/YloC family endoribonuclease n=1 Tax=Peptoniphilus obesi TaxID=1472765 RepID=UPI0004ACE393|nr:YicC/YloC family endoribonuclease [Peptoniphilus obesi]
MNSMTGYGLGISSDDKLKVKIEIKSVNNRYCDINVRLPRTLIFIEEKIKKEIKSRVHRGKIDVFLNLDYLNISEFDVSINKVLAKQYYDALSDLKDEFEIEDKIGLRDIYAMQGVMTNISSDLDEDLYSKLIFAALNEALDNFIKMRNVEGENIKESFEEILANIRIYADKIKELAPKALEENQEKLKETISNNVDEKYLDLPRLTTELAIMADKLSIDEEITRVFSHLSQFNDIIKGKGAIGRKLDFLVQELNREINTIASKTNNIDILQIAVEAKSDIEKLREQIQNIE